MGVHAIRSQRLHNRGCHSFVCVDRLITSAPHGHAWHLPSVGQAAGKRASWVTSEAVFLLRDRYGGKAAGSRVRVRAHIEARGQTRSPLHIQKNFRAFLFGSNYILSHRQFLSLLAVITRGARTLPGFLLSLSHAEMVLSAHQIVVGGGRVFFAALVVGALDLGLKAGHGGADRLEARFV
ncbi:hypothetical protein D2T32_05455 [Sinirhodobacter populi]|nr:hypothetical protein D2T32_05455 [Sinirhodobacter populi]